MERRQAEAAAVAISQREGNLATKSDINLLRTEAESDINLLRTELKSGPTSAESSRPSLRSDPTSLRSDRT